MLKRLLIVGAIVALVVAVAVPASAAKVVKTPHVIAECDGTTVSPPDRVWMTGQDGMHIRGLANEYTEYLLEGQAWRAIGTNETRPNANINPPNVTLRGTFSFRGEIGDFDGTWAWGNSTYGRATGKSADGKLVKITLGLDPTGFPPPPGVGCLLTEFLVMEPNG